MMRFGSPIGTAGLIAGFALVCAAPALADVKDGVDAWASGDFARAVAEWKGPAAKGDADALFNLGQAYRLGRGVAEDSKRAEKLYAQAAERGHIKAADNYGLLLFQEGRREAAMPYVTAAAERGDPRAQYLIGIGHFNGDLMPKDWVRAYALLTLANGAGLPQASPAIKQMDEFVPLAQREQAQVLAAQMRASADARRSSEMTAADLGHGFAAVTEPPLQIAAATPLSLPTARVPQPVIGIAVPASSVDPAGTALGEATRATGTESPATAGADFARPGQGSNLPSRAANEVERAPIRSARSLSEPATTASGPWKLQLGAFSVPANADRLWAQLAGRAVLAGKGKQAVPAGRLTRLLASGWSSEAAARSACVTLKAAGQACIVTR